DGAGCAAGVVADQAVVVAGEAGVDRGADVPLGDACGAVACVEDVVLRAVVDVEARGAAAAASCDGLSVVDGLLHAACDVLDAHGVAELGRLLGELGGGAVLGLVGDGDDELVVLGVEADRGVRHADRFELSARGVELFGGAGHDLGGGARGFGLGGGGLGGDVHDGLAGGVEVFADDVGRQRGAEFVERVDAVLLGLQQGGGGHLADAPFARQGGDGFVRDDVRVALDTRYGGRCRGGRGEHSQGQGSCHGGDGGLARRFH